MVKPISNGRIDDQTLAARTINPIKNDGGQYVFPTIKWFGTETVGSTADTTKLKCPSCRMFRLIKKKSEEQLSRGGPFTCERLAGAKCGKRSVIGHVYIPRAGRMKKDVAMFATIRLQLGKDAGYVPSYTSEEAKAESRQAKAYTSIEEEADEMSCQYAFVTRDCTPAEKRSEEGITAMTDEMKKLFLFNALEGPVEAQEIRQRNDRGEATVSRLFMLAQIKHAQIEIEKQKYRGRCIVEGSRIYDLATGDRVAYSVSAIWCPL